MTQLTNSVFLTLAEALFGKKQPEPVEAESNGCEGCSCDCTEDAAVYREASAGVFVSLKGIVDNETAFAHAEALKDYMQASQELSGTSGKTSFNIQDYNGSAGIELHASIQFDGESEDVMSAMLNAVYLLETYVEDMPKGEASGADVSHHFNATSEWIDVSDDSTSGNSLV